MHETRNVRRQGIARRFLLERDSEGLRAWAAEESRATAALVSLLFDADPLVRWRAIEGLGPVAAVVYGRSPEKVRKLVRRLLWLMNDESGGLCWNAPEAIGEILRSSPPLIAEFGPILPSFFVEEPFERGSRLAVSRVAPVDASPFSGAAEPLAASLDDPDPGVRASSALALAALGQTGALEARPDLLDDAAPADHYDFETGELGRTTVGAVVRGCLPSGE